MGGSCELSAAGFCFTAVKGENQTGVFQHHRQLHTHTHARSEPAALIGPQVHRWSSLEPSLKPEGHGVFSALRYDPLLSKTFYFSPALLFYLSTQQNFCLLLGKEKAMSCFSLLKCEDLLPFFMCDDKKSFLFLCIDFFWG